MDSLILVTEVPWKLKAEGEFCLEVKTHGQIKGKKYIKTPKLFKMAKMWFISLRVSVEWGGEKSLGPFNLRDFHR